MYPASSYWDNVSNYRIRYILFFANLLRNMAADFYTAANYLEKKRR